MESIQEIKERFKNTPIQELPAFCEIYRADERKGVQKLVEQGHKRIAALEKEKEIYRVQALNEGKPENIVEKMVMGRIQKYYKEVCLLDQAWVKDGDKSIAKFLEEKSKEVGSPITITRYARFERGEGIEKVEEDFAAEVAKTMGM